MSQTEAEIQNGETAENEELQTTDNRPLTLEEQRVRLRQLVIQGKDRGYITYAEINDALPDDMSDAEQIDNIVNMIQGLGIQVTEEAPDAETLLMSDNSAGMTDEDAVAEAEAALSQADSEFGRTTDPVRMYMREMGQVDLLTREDEIVIAKEIEHALKNMIQAISACPGSVAEILALIDQIKKDEIRVDEVVEAIIDPNEVLLNELGLSHLESPPVPAAQKPSQSDDDADADADSEDEEDGEDTGSIESANLEELKAQVIEHFKQIEKSYTKMNTALNRYGSSNAKYIEHRNAIASKLLEVRFSTRQIESLSQSMRNRVDQIRKLEREIRDICLDRVRMDRDYFLQNFLPNMTNLEWLEDEIGKNRVWGDALDRFRHAILEKQTVMSELEQHARISIAELKEISKNMVASEKETAAAKQKMIQANLRLVISIAKKYTNRGLQFLDLIQEGNIGLMKAVKRFDPRQGVRLVSFAIHWIKAEIHEYVLRNWRLVKVATTKAQRKLFFNLRSLKSGSEALSPAQIADISQQLNVKPEEVAEMETRLSGRDLALDAGNDEDDAVAPIAYLEDSRHEPMRVLERQAADHLQGEGLQAALGILDERSRRIVEARWLADDPATLHELAAEFGVSAERIRQIESKAMQKMREHLTPLAA